MTHYQAIKETNTFCINLKVNFGADLWAFFLSKRNSYFACDNDIMLEINLKFNVCFTCHNYR